MVGVTESMQVGTLLVYSWQTASDLVYVAFFFVFRLQSLQATVVDPVGVEGGGDVTLIVQRTANTCRSY